MGLIIRGDVPRLNTKFLPVNIYYTRHSRNTSSLLSVEYSLYRQPPGSLFPFLSKLISHPTHQTSPSSSDFKRLIRKIKILVSWQSLTMYFEWEKKSILRLCMSMCVYLCVYTRMSRSNSAFYPLSTFPCCFWSAQSWWKFSLVRRITLKDRKYCKPTETYR